jgi:hypothetical protein
MKRFGDRPHNEIDTREVSRFPRDLDEAGLTPRNVNKHRSVLHAIFNYAMKPDTYALESNPVTGTDVRAVPVRRRSTSGARASRRPRRGS